MKPSNVYLQHIPMLNAQVSNSQKTAPAPRSLASTWSQQERPASSVLQVSGMYHSGPRERYGDTMGRVLGHRAAVNTAPVGRLRRGGGGRRGRGGLEGEGEARGGGEGNNENANARLVGVTYSLDLRAFHSKMWRSLSRPHTRGDEAVRNFCAAG